MNRIKLKAQLKRHEGYRRRPYKDTKGILTIGFGRNLIDNGINREEADHLLDNDIRETLMVCATKIKQYEQFPEEVQEVVVNMCFNMGINRLLTFKKMLAAMRARDFKTAAVELMDSNYATQVGRRANELAEILEEIIDEVPA